MTDLTTKTARNKLQARREPHWTRIYKYCHLGFRRGPDTWVARFTIRDANRHRYVYKALDANSYDVGKKAAEQWFVAMGSSAARAVVRGTVCDALDTYVTYLREQGRDDTADNAQDRFRLIILDDPIANCRLEELTRQDFREWRERIRTGRKNRTVNRHVRSVVAGLNRATKEGHIGNPDAWRLDPLIDHAETQTTVFLTPSQRKSIINEASPACRDFLRAIEYTGGRPGELAVASVGDLDANNATLTLRHKKGRPPALRARAVVLSHDALKFFKRLAREKTPAAPLLTDSEGAQWNRHKWSDEVQTAIAQVNASARGDERIPFGSSAYSFRHARISELLQTYGIDPVTVAQQTGTSTRMIEQSYFKFIAPVLRDRLSAIGGSI